MNNVQLSLVDFYSNLDLLDDEDKIVKFIKKNAMYLVPKDRLEVYQKYKNYFKRSLKVKSGSIFSQNNNEILPELIDIFVDIINPGHLLEAINKIDDFNTRLNYLYKYANRLKASDSEFIDDTFNRDPEELDDMNIISNVISNSSKEFCVEFIKSLNDNIKVNLLDKMEDDFSPEDLSSILSGFSDYSKLINAFEKYKDKISKDRYCRVLFRINNKDLIYDFLARYESVLTPLNYEYIAVRKFEKKDQILFIEKYIDKLDKDSVKKILINNVKSIKSQYDFTTKKFQGLVYSRNEFLEENYIFDVIKRFSNYLDLMDIGDIITNIENVNSKNKTFFETIGYFNPNINNLINNLDEEQRKTFKKNIMNLSNSSLASLFSIYADESYNIDDLDALLYCVEFTNKIDKSNSSEIRRISGEILRQIVILPRDEWENTYNYIEDIFMKNNIPYVGKVYEIFQKLHKDKKSLLHGVKSPNLLSLKSMKAQELMIFNDLLKCSIKSNNRSLKNYIKDIKNGNMLMESLISGALKFDDLHDDDKIVFQKYLAHLNSLYNCTQQGRLNPRNLKNDMQKDCHDLLNLFMKEGNFSTKKLPDRIVSMFTHFIGIDSIDQLESYINLETEKANTRNIERANQNDFLINSGDLIKGLSGNKGQYYNYLTSILQNGNLCQEFLGSAASSDATPLDADVCMAAENYSNFKDAFTDRRLASSGYGPLWIVIKNDGKLNNTSINNKIDSNKLEVFYTGVLRDNHFGVRTGIPSSDIDFFVVDTNVKTNIIKYEIVMNGFYIPIVDKNGKLVFTPEEYEKMKNNMQGLSYYGTEKNYSFAKELDDYTSHSDDLKMAMQEVANKREGIYNKLKSTGLNIILGRTEELTNGNLELIDTGSTGRGTNKPEDYDFDFIMRVDRSVMFDVERKNSLLNKIKEAFPGIKIESNGNIRDQKVILDNGEYVKIDITLIPKTDKLDYSTDECIKDRLSNIKQLDEEKYYKILENIILAKEVLKDCYKPKHAGGGKAQGGLGGVGIENWVLQNGGSFVAAAKDFVANSEGLNFSSFKEKYTVWDFGENHMSSEKGKYLHDEFVSNNMDEDGYDKMKQTLKAYLLQLEQTKSVEESINSGFKK